MYHFWWTFSWKLISFPLISYSWTNHLKLLANGNVIFFFGCPTSLKHFFVFTAFPCILHYHLILYHKIWKISPGAHIFQRPFVKGLSTEGNLLFKIDWASLIVGRKFTVFALFLLFQVQAPGGLYLEGRLHREFFALPIWGAYIWRGLFSEFYDIL